METLEFALPTGGKFEVTINQCQEGEGITIVQKFISDKGEKAGSVTVTCTCSDSVTGKTYSATKQCPSERYTCNCSTLSNPTISCG